jgi:clan AA aspartic protease (TIGR02281 family)
MICPKCHSSFEIPANFCPNCGVSLQRSGGRLLIITSALVLLILIGVYGYVQHQFFKRADEGGQTSICPNPDDLWDQRTDDLRVSSPEVFQSTDRLLPIPSARLSLADISGREILSLPVAILSSGWIAVPRQPSIGGYTWQVTLESGHLYAVEGGILNDTDPVGLWQLPVEPLNNRPELASWMPNRPLTWQPLNDPQDNLSIQVGDIDLFSDVARVPFKNDAAEPGIFVQDGRVVGWSFGQLIPGGYLWMGNSGSELIPEFYTEDFYRLTFEGGREEAFLLAIYDTNLSEFQQLSGLVEAYRLQSRLTHDETPAHIRPARIFATMRDLIERLQVQGRGEEILALFDSQTVATINHPQLVTDLAAIARKTGDYAYALALVNSFETSFDSGVVQRQKIDVLQAALYRGWLNQLIVEGDINDARLIYEEAIDHFPQDAAIHLAGVELALQLQNWPLAERLLAARNYPVELRETVRRLQQGISELKTQEDKIVIRYAPGSRTIPVTARLDRRLNQHFLIDTGASIVTVPFATVRRLGIDLTTNLPRRLFYSATGVHNAIEVTLPSIELNGWVIEDVKALVVDLPGKSGMGLLGMNYLKNFRLDLNTSEGVLLLEPR